MTAFSVFFYFKHSNNSDVTFILSIVYALFLFVIGLYINERTAKIQNDFFIRKEQYLNLNQLSGMLSLNDNTRQDLFEYLITAKALTGRSSKNFKGPIIMKMNGINFSKRYLTKEESYLSINKSIAELIRCEVDSYIKNKELKPRVLHTHIHNIDEFIDTSRKWSDNYLKLNDEESLEFISHIESIKKQNSKLFRKYYKNANILINIVQRSKKKCDFTLTKFKEIYGNQLNYSLDADELLHRNFQEIKEKITGLENIILSEETYIIYSREMKRLFEQISYKLDEIDNLIQDNIMEDNDFSFKN